MMLENMFSGIVAANIAKHKAGVNIIPVQYPGFSGGIPAARRLGAALWSMGGINRSACGVLAR